MPEDITLEETTTYAKPADVAGELLKPDNYFTNDTVPSQTRVSKMIMQSEEFIDSQLRRAWRERKRSNEYVNGRMNQMRHSRAGYKFILDRGDIKELDSTKGDKFEVWNGSEYVDYLATKEEGRDKDYWLDYEAGVLYIRNFVLRSYEKIIKLTYRYGQSTVPLDINDAVAKMVAIKILTNEDNSFILNEGGDTKTMMYDPRIATMKKSVKDTLLNYTNRMFTL